MLEIIEQETSSKEGNDCLIEDCYVVLKCHYKYIVMSIRKYRGWCDDGGLDYRGKREFDDCDSAMEYYNGGLRKL